MLWQRNPRCGTLRGPRLTCEHPSVTLSCTLANPQRGGAFFCCGVGEVKDANPCGIKSFCARTDPDTYSFKDVCKRLLPRGSAARSFVAGNEIFEEVVGNAENEKYEYHMPSSGEGVSSLPIIHYQILCTENVPQQ